MEKLIIPNGCVIQGDIAAISNEGDIEIAGELVPTILNSGKGDIQITTERDNTRIEKVIAQNGRVEIQARSLSLGEITAQSVQLKTSDLTIDSAIRTTGALTLESAAAAIPLCQAENIQIKAHSLTADRIEASGDLVIRAARLQAHTIQARKVILQGNIECKQINAVEGVVMESGHISIKSLNSPSFHAAAEVTGIVMVATSTDVKAQGVRGFIHPSELEMLSQGQDPVSVPTVMLSAAADDWTTQEPPLVDEPIASPPFEDNVQRMVEPENFGPEDEIATEELSDDEILEVDEIDPEPEAKPKIPDPTLRVLVPDEDAREDEPTDESLPAPDPPLEPSPEIIEPPTQELAPEELETLAEDDDFDDDDFVGPELDDSEEDILDSISPEDAPSFDEDEEDDDLSEDDLDDPLRAIEALHLGDMEPDESLQMPTDIFDSELGESINAFDLMEIEQADMMNEEDELSSEDLEAVAEITGELTDESLDLPIINPEEELAQDLGVIIAQIRDYFSEDNYPNSINQIQRFIEERRFNLFAKPRNQEAVLANFDKYDHKEISRLARVFFDRLDRYYQSQS